MLVRGEVELGRSVHRARLYATAHGIYELFVNGERVGDAELTPGFTAYGERLQVQAYDLTGILREGSNALGAVLSDGWFRGQVGLTRAHDQWGSRLAFLAQGGVDYEDGSRAVFGTGDGWRGRRSHIAAADGIAGQSTDLRRAAEGWNSPGFDDSAWATVAIAEHGYDTLVASPAPPVRAVQELAPLAVSRVGGAQVFDLGQNINGRVRLADLGPRDTELEIVHGEALDADGDVTTAHLDVNVPFLPHPLRAGQVDRVVSSGRPGEVFEPRHTTHGFRFVRVEGHPGELTVDDLTGVVVHTDMTRTGWFECSDDSPQSPARSRRLELQGQRVRHPDRLSDEGASGVGPVIGRSSSRPRRSSTTSPGSRPSGCATWPPSSGQAASSQTSRRALRPNPRAGSSPSSTARRGGATRP